MKNKIQHNPYNLCNPFDVRYLLDPFLNQPLPVFMSQIFEDRCAPNDLREDRYYELLFWEMARFSYHESNEFFGIKECKICSHRIDEDIPISFFAWEKPKGTQLKKFKLELKNRNKCSDCLTGLAISGEL